jgi:DNA invertase Pin-like site-specific DNA recombinase
VVTKLDRLAGALPDARAIADELITRRIRLLLGGSIYDATEAVGRLSFDVVAVVAGFDSDLIRSGLVRGMMVAEAVRRRSVDATAIGSPAGRMDAAVARLA